jgi:hypothetical protein
MKLQWEAKPLGVPLDGSSAQAQVAWSDTGVDGASLGGVAGGGGGNQIHHWRVRLLYDSVTTPLLPRGRWLTMPWAGWQESMVRTSAAAAPPGNVRTLLVTKSGTDIELSWSSECPAADYAIYEGAIGSFTDHEWIACSTSGATSQTFTPASESVYYLVVPLDGSVEGSYGTTGSGLERPVGSPACRPQQLGACR